MQAYLPDIPVVHGQLAGWLGSELQPRILTHFLQVSMTHPALMSHTCIFKVSTLTAQHEVIEAFLRSMHNKDEVHKKQVGQLS